MSACAICDRIQQITTEGNPALIYEFPLSFFLVGDHQYYPGYCLLIYKEHLRELHELTPDLQDALNRELMQATKAVVESFQPWKVNHACLGNQDEHIHWHIIPRYQSDPDHRNHPWKHADEFAQHKISTAEQKAIAEQIRRNL